MFSGRSNEALYWKLFWDRRKTESHYKDCRSARLANIVSGSFVEREKTEEKIGTLEKIAS